MNKKCIYSVHDGIFFIPVDLNRCNVVVMFQDERLQSVGLRSQHNIKICQLQ